jgi:hypothetical protein
LKNTTKTSKRTYTRMPETDEAIIRVIQRGIRKKTLELSGFEKLVYEAGKRSVKCPKKL